MVTTLCGSVHKLQCATPMLSPSDDASREGGFCLLAFFLFFLSLGFDDDSVLFFLTFALFVYALSFSQKKCVIEMLLKGV